VGQRLQHQRGWPDIAIEMAAHQRCQFHGAGGPGVGNRLIETAHLELAHTAHKQHFGAAHRVAGGAAVAQGFGAGGDALFAGLARRRIIRLGTAKQAQRAQHDQTATELFAGRLPPAIAIAFQQRRRFGKCWRRSQQQRPGNGQATNTRHEIPPDFDPVLMNCGVMALARPWHNDRIASPRARL